MMIPLKKLLWILSVTTLVACSNGQQNVSQNLNSLKQIGIASYYADKYQLEQTASGELFDQNKATAAHKTFAFGTSVKVTNLKNNQSVIVKINDRGPFVNGRIIDLSKSAFNTIGNVNTGLIEVSVEILR
ncbi:MAG: septal ring lytic transglycosylase RlpA family protein [Cocleimonas sp.]